MLQRHNALAFDKSLYVVEDVALSPYDLTYVYICVTFVVLGEQDQTIISNYDEGNPDLPFREISASNKEIRIWGAKTKSSYVPIEHKAKETDWTTVFVEWSTNTQGSFYVNGKETVGTFTSQDITGDSRRANFHWWKIWRKSFI